MISRIFKLCALIVVLTTLFAASWASRATAASGTFMAVMNEATENADSRKSITFYDGQDIGAGPLFSVFIPFEIAGSNNAYEDPSGFTVDPNTGDIYIVAFDSGGIFDTNDPDENIVDAGNPGPGVPEDDDTLLDFDVYRLNFAPVYEHWQSNFEGHDIRDGGFGGPAVGGQLPVYTLGMPAGALDDYVTYGVTTPYVEERMLDGVHLSTDGVFDNRNFDDDSNPAPSHSNTFVLGDMLTPGGAFEKVGEIARNAYSATPNFHKVNMEFIDEDTLFMVDDSRKSKSATLQAAANEHDYRIIDRVDTDPGMAMSDTPVIMNPGTNASVSINGGFNRTTTESWESRKIGQMNLDGDEISTSVFSEPQATVYHDTGAGVRGVWVSERDRALGGSNPVPDAVSGDDIAFLQLDSNNNIVGYRPISNYGGATKFDMLNNPAGAASFPDNYAGRIGQVFVDSDTGDLIVVEEGFTDSAMAGGPGVSEPGVIRVSVDYDDGGQITLGAWGAKQLLMPAKDTADTFNERGYFSAYDSANDLVYFMSPGEADDDPEDPLTPDGEPPEPNDSSIDFAADIYVLDLSTGMTTSYLNMDGSVSLFFGMNNTDNGDSLVAFTLPSDPGGLDGDYNGNGIIDAADYTVWRDALTAGSSSLLNDSTPGVVDESDFTYWRNNFGNIMGSGAGNGSVAIPEPGSLALLVIGLAGLWAGRRRGQ